MNDFAIKYLRSYPYPYPIQNLPIERFWPEVNGRLNYPIKLALAEMDNARENDMENEVFRFCLSFVPCIVANHGLQIVILSWNQRSISGKINFTVQTIFTSGNT